MLALALALLSPAARADRLVVDPAGGGAFTELQDAVDAALPGDYIALYAGVHSAAVLNAWGGPIVSLDGAALTFIDGGASSYALDLSGGGELLLRDVSLLGGSSGGLYVRSGHAVLQRVSLLSGTYGAAVSGSGALDAQGLRVQGNTYGLWSNASGLVRLTGATFVDNVYHLSASGGDFELSELITWGGVPITACSSGSAVTLSYALLGDFSGAPYPTCVTARSVTIGVDAMFTRFTDDGEWSNDDLELRSNSPGINAGAPSCRDPDGTRCDLGGLAGPVADVQDSDADGMSDAWELAFGLDPDLDDGDLDDDGDGLDNLGESLFGTDPLDADSDADGVEDLDELRAQADPNDPSDQAPVAALDASPVGFLSEAMQLDASASSDPSGDALAYTWAFAELPSGSALRDADLPSGDQGSFTPDAVGRYTLELIVSDGVQTDRLEHTVDVLASRVIHLPGDFETWEDIEDLLVEGMEVVFGEGEFAIGGALPDDLTLRGQGADRTTLVGQLGVPIIRIDSGRLALRDLTLEGSTSYGLRVHGGWVDAQRVDLNVDGTYGVYLADGATLTGVDMDISAAVPLYNYRSIVYLGRSRLIASDSSAFVGYRDLVTDLSGVLFDGAGLSLSAPEAAALSFVTVRGADTAVVVQDSATTTIDHLLLDRVGVSASCDQAAALQLDHLLSVGSAVAIDRCAEPLVWASETQALDDEARPQPGSAAIDGGDWRLRDADGSPADIGATGGPLGLFSSDGLADPEADEDGDGLSALTELLLGASDQLTDSDGDGVPDLTELLAGDDASDPDDHLPQVDDAAVRVSIGEDPGPLSVALLGVDPDGDVCGFTWDDGASGETREVPTDSPGVQRYGWSWTCGQGARRGELWVIVEQPVEVPAERSLREALAEAEDHHVLHLAEGVYVDPIDLTGRATALVGSGPGTVLYNDVVLDHPAAWLSDLSVRDQGLWQAGGHLRRVDVIHTEAWLADVDARNLLLFEGPLHLRGEESSLEYFTTTGTLDVDTSSLACGASLGSSRLGRSVISAQVRLAETGRLSEADFIRVDPDPELAILEPWPGSLLVDDCGSRRFDLDGSVADLGVTGGPDAAPTDVDGDGLSDRWEDWRGVDDPLDDPDDDGLNNLGEFGANTDPHDPDTDDDRIGDGEDERPLIPDTEGVVARIDVDRFPVAGQRVLADAWRSSDPLGTALRFDWTLQTPQGSGATLDISGTAAGFSPDVRGPYDLTLTVTTEDEQVAVAESRVWLGQVIVVPEGQSLQSAVDAANPGDRILLEEGNFRANLQVDKDLVIAHAEGALNGRLDGPDGAPCLTVTGGALVRVEGLTLRPDEGDLGALVNNSELELRQARIIGGAIGVQAGNAKLDLQASALLGSDTALALYGSEGRAVNTVIGYGIDEGVPLYLQDGRLSLVASVIEQPPGSRRLLSGGPPSYLLLNHVIVDEAFDEHPFIEVIRLWAMSPQFLLSPSDASSWVESDLRLSPSSVGIDAGPEGYLDPDGGPLDIGVHGGPWGDWPDVDNDRDGFTNLEGDCDDADPALFPDPYTGVCGDTSCGGCASGGSGAGASLSLLALLALLRRRQHPRAPTMIL